jgi:hypothetical protein
MDHPFDEDCKTYDGTGADDQENDVPIRVRLK